MNDNFDNFLKRKFKEESVDETRISSNIDKIINNMFESKRKNKKIILMILPILLMTSTVFAVAYSMFNLSSVGIDDTCLDIAVQNGYIQILNMEMQEFEGVSIRINKFLIDDINMDIGFEYKVNNENMKDIRNIYIQDLYIYDENNNVLFDDDELGEEKVIAQTSGYSKIQKRGDVLSNTFFAQSDKFPKSKKIYIKFNRIILNCKEDNVGINGNWKYEINVPQNMQDRENISYKPISNNNNNKIFIKSVKMTNTGLIINTVAPSNEVLDKSEIEIIANGKTIKNNSNVFEKNARTDKEQTEYVFTYNLTKYNAPEEIIVRIKEKREEREIVFIKDEEA